MLNSTRCNTFNNDALYFYISSKDTRRTWGRFQVPEFIPGVGKVLQLADGRSQESCWTKPLTRVSWSWTCALALLFLQWISSLSLHYLVSYACWNFYFSFLDFNNLLFPAPAVRSALYKKLCMIQDWHLKSFSCPLNNVRVSFLTFVGTFQIRDSMKSSGDVPSQELISVHYLQNGMRCRYNTSTLLSPIH